MTAPRRALLVVGASLLLVASAPVVADAPAPRDLSAAFEKIRAKHDMPGVVGVTLEGDRIVAKGAAGLRRRGGKDAITVDDKMHLGSCTKAMTATLCALLVAEGKLHWDDRPAGVFAKEAKVDPGWKDATLEMLLRNRGGAPTDLDAGGLWARLWGHPGPPRAARLALVEGVLAHAPVAPPGTRYEYSNAGFSMAGTMAERAAGVAWEDLIRARLFEPLAMKSAGFGAPGTASADGRVDQPRGHAPDGHPIELGPGSDNPDAIAPAGKVHASLPDWGRFVALHLRRGAGSPGALAKIDFAKLHDPPVVDGKPTDYAMGWSVAERPWAKGTATGDHGRVLTHNGSNSMWYCVAWLAPERGFAVLAATNQGGDAAAAAADEIAGALIEDELRAK